MRMNQPLLLLFLSAACLPALAVDAVTACPKNFTVLAEDDRVRILRFVQKKGESCKMHSHPHIAAYILKAGEPLKYKMPDGSIKTGPKYKAGDAFVRAGTEHEHLASGGQAEAIIVELKQ